MRTIKIALSLFIMICLYQADAWAQNKRPSRSTQKSTQSRAKAQPKKEQHPSQRNYEELHLGLNLISGRFTLDVAGDKANLRGQMQGLSLTYTYYRPSQKNISWLYSYGFGITAGIAKASPEPFQPPFIGHEVKNRTWFMGSFVPGLDYRRSHRARVGVFAPVLFRILDFGYDKDTAKVFDNDPFSVGLGLRYINALSTRDSVSVSFAHQFIWTSSTWELVWQRRLGL